MSDSCSSPTGHPSDCEIMEGYRSMARKRGTPQTDPYRMRALARAKEIKLLLLDVDGVLTDATLLYSDGSGESKSFHTKDGFGLRLLREAGISTGIITARKSEVVQRRAVELKMDYIHQGAIDKNNAFREIRKQSGLKPFEIAYMGDDWLDLVLLLQVGLAVAPADAEPEVLEAVHFITKRDGGHGAVRDCCNLLLESRDSLSKLLQKYKTR
ncbi:KdsC family phosphatase [Desulfomarina profundi]|nr:HAD hydrolase family protein [Desulfomarina profundi]